MRSERGTSVVETALMVPLLLFMVVGVIDFGRAYVTAIQIRDAAQEGAIYASYEPGDHTVVRDRVLDGANNDLEPDLALPDITINCPPDGSIEITVSYDVPLITPVIGSWLSGGAITLTHTAVGNNFSQDSCDPSP